MTMRYTESSLLTNEKLIYGIRPHWIIFSTTVWAVFAAIYVLFFAPINIPFYVWGNISVRVAAGLGFLAASIYLFLNAFIYYLNSEYGVTNKRVLIKTGWIQRASLEIMLDKVEGVLVDQSILGRIFNYGMITIIGTGGTRDSFPYIPDPLRFRKVVQEQIAAMEEQYRRMG